MMSFSRWAALLCTAVVHVLAVGGNNTPMSCLPPLTVALFKTEGAEWCEQFCVPLPLVPTVRQFGDVEYGKCETKGYPHYDHSEDMKLFKVDLYKSDQGSTVGEMLGESEDRSIPLHPEQSDIEADCQAMKPDPILNASVVWGERACNFSCAARDNLACMTCPDGLGVALGKAGMPDSRSICSHTFWPSEDDPELVTQVCPEWRLVLDLTSAHGKLGGMVVTLSMYTDTAVKAISEALRPQPGIQYV